MLENHRPVVQIERPPVVPEEEQRLPEGVPLLEELPLDEARLHPDQLFVGEVERIVEPVDRLQNQMPPQHPAAQPDLQVHHGIPVRPLLVRGEEMIEERGDRARLHVQEERLKMKPVVLVAGQGHHVGASAFRPFKQVGEDISEVDHGIVDEHEALDRAAIRLRKRRQIASPHAEIEPAVLRGEQPDPTLGKKAPRIAVEIALIRNHDNRKARPNQSIERIPDIARQRHSLLIGCVEDEAFARGMHFCLACHHFHLLVFLTS